VTSTISASTTAPDTNRIAPKLTASMENEASAIRFRMELAAKAIMVRAEARNRRMAATGTPAVLCCQLAFRAAIVVSATIKRYRCASEQDSGGPQ
jgi:hypothetical protein